MVKHTKGTSGLFVKSSSLQKIEETPKPMSLDPDSIPGTKPRATRIKVDSVCRSGSTKDQRPKSSTS